MLKNLYFLFLTFFAASYSFCKFDAEMLGLTPGSDITELNLNWYSDVGKGSESSVRLFDDSGKLVSTAEGISGSASEGKLYHKVTLKKLTPGAKYKYAVSNNKADWSTEYNYTAPAAGNSFKFAVVADPQLTAGNPNVIAQNWKESIGKIAATTGVNLIVSAGDQVDAAGNEDEYGNFFAPPQLRNIPFAPVVGNHDVHCLFIYHYNLPNEQNAKTTCAANSDANSVANYYYLYNNILFIALNTSAYPNNALTAEPYINVFKKTIEAAKTAFAKKYDWIVVYHHKSTASLAIHVMDNDIKAYVDAGFQKLMTAQGVDLVIAGHDHIYARSRHTVDDRPSENGKGIIYLTLTTASGLKYYNPSPNANLDAIAKYNASRTPEYTIVDVNGKSMTITTYGINNNTPYDAFTLTK